MAKRWRRFKRRLKELAAIRRLRKVTCLDCGFLAHGSHEVTTPDRVILHMKGSAGVMIGEWQKIRCSRSLWVSYELTYAAPSLQGIFDELEDSRRTCEGFYRYIPGLSPSQHLERALKDADRGVVKWIIEKVLFFLK